MTVLPSLLRSTLVLAVATTGASASAADPATAEQRVREEVRVLLLELVQSGAFGATPPEQIALSLDEPGRRVANLGLLVDSTSAERARDGLHVLGTTPGGSAERMGLRSGDVITTVNGRSLAGLGSHAQGGSQAAVDLREAVEALADGAELAFDVRRDGRPLQLRGTPAGTWLPAFRLTIGNGTSTVPLATTAASGCGRVSIVDVAPRQQGLHAVVLNRIDGRTAGVGEQTSFRLPAGEHVLELGERIESRYLGINDRLRNRSQPRYKSLVVRVQAGTTQFIAAQLHADKRTDWVDGAYWDPVVWREVAEPCE